MGVLRGPMLLFLFFVMGLYRWVGKVFCKDNDYFIPASSIGGFQDSVEWQLKVESTKLNPPSKLSSITICLKESVPNVFSAKNAFLYS
jgi:hypothetical protein